MRPAQRFFLGALLASITLLVSSRGAEAAPVRLWTELVGLAMGSAPSAVAGALKGAKLKKQKLRGKKNKGKSALAEKVVFERHSPASVTYRFADDKLYELELRYAKKGRTKRMASFLQKKFGNCKQKGKARTCRAGERNVVFKWPGGKVVLTFTSPAVLAAFAKAHAPKKKPPADEEEDGDEPGGRASAAAKAKEREKRLAAKRAAEAAAAEEEERKKRRGKVIAKRADDPALWDLLGVKSGVVTLFKTLLRPKGGAQLVAAGFRRAGNAPLAAILSHDEEGYRMHHLGTSCAGTPEEAQAVDFRFDGRSDVALFTRAGDTRHVALVPFDARYAGAKFIGGRFGGKNAYRCFELGEDLERLDFADIDHDKSIDLLLTYRHPTMGLVHDVYYFQGNDFYFRESRPGAPRPRNK